MFPKETGSTKETLCIYAGGRRLETRPSGSTLTDVPAATSTVMSSEPQQEALRAELLKVWGNHAKVYFTASDFCKALLQYADGPTVAVLAGGVDPNCELLDFTLFAMSAGYDFVVVVRPPAGSRVTIKSNPPEPLPDATRFEDLACEVEICPEKPPLACQVGSSRRYDKLLFAEPGVRPVELDEQLRLSRWSLRHRAEQWASKLANQRISLLPDSKLPKLYMGHVTISELVSPAQLAILERDVQTLEFDTFEYDSDELLAAGFILLKAVFRMPGLEEHALCDSKLVWFLMVLRRCYTGTTPYHNFAHVIDVLQATIYCLVHSGVLPPFSALFDSAAEAASLAPYPDVPVMQLAALIVAAPGHDLFHPGFNAKVMCKGKCCFKSLEAFHAALYLEMLQQLWPVMAQGETGELVRQIILATDMARHNEFLQNDSGLPVGPPGPNDSPEARALYLCRVIKVADLFNAARPFAVSYKHALSINKEFDWQSQTEQILGWIPSQECGKLEYEKDGFKEPSFCGQRLKKRQMFFTNVFVRPLFDLMSQDPRQKFLIKLLQSNEASWNEYWSQPPSQPDLFKAHCCAI